MQGDESQLEFVEKLLLPAAQEAVPQQHAVAPPPEAAMKFGVGDAVLGKFGPDDEGKTGGVLEVTALFPNHLLRSQIATWREAQAQS